jgi:hypothetical protein
LGAPDGIPFAKNRRYRRRLICNKRKMRGNEGKQPSCLLSGAATSFPL